MSKPDTDMRFTDEVALQKAMAIQRSARINWAVSVFLVIAVVVGIGTWFSAKPINRDDLHGGLALGLALGTFCLFCLAGRLLFPPLRPKCPKCGHDWMGSVANDDWLTWTCCPGCGLRMSDEDGPSPNV